MADEDNSRRAPTNDAADADDADDSAKAYLESTVTRVLHDALVALNDARPSAPVKFLVDYLTERADAVDGEIAAKRGGSGNAAPPANGDA